MQGIPKLNKAEIDILKVSANQMDFLIRYLKTFGFEERPPMGITQIWYRRKQIFSEAEEKVKPAESTKTQPILTKDSRTEQELLVLILNELRYLTKINKERLEQVDRVYPRERMITISHDPKVT